MVLPLMPIASSIVLCYFCPLVFNLMHYIVVPTLLYHICWNEQVFEDYLYKR